MKDQVRTPLRTVLRNFLNHIEKLESSTCPEKSYDAEFQDLKLFSESVKSLKDYACNEGEKETNKKKNRYKDILPFDVSRVILNEYAGIPGSDYINANYIKGASGSPAYIASQGPLPCTVNDFWRMVVQCEVQVIVMACNEEEAGKAKCEKYWVDEGEEKQFGMISVKLLKASTVCPDFSVRTMRLKYTNAQKIIEERTVCQLHYVAWPDHGVPTVVQPLLEMVRLVRDTQASETLPVLVHCSAGCGRTGTICAIDYVWGLLRTGKLTDDFSLLSLIREMRKQRIAMVQTKEQYVLVHQAVRELFKEQLLMIDSHPYENVDPDGLLIMKEEENHYDTVENLSSMNLDEKKDNTMEKDVAPPLPQKKHAFYPSKQEKDVENLSAQQRSMMHGSKGKHQSVTNAVRQSPRIPATHDVPQQHAPPLVQKKMPNPIPSKGILRVPHLRSISSAPVKRSKSLKLTNMTVRQKIAVSAEIPVEIRRRGSLESNIDETGSVLGDGTFSEMPNKDVTPTKEVEDLSPIYDTPRAVQKYDMLKYLEEKRMLVRSLTTYDMRQKIVAQNLPLEAKNTDNTPNKCKLSRSNTQIDFSRLVRSRVVERKPEPPCSQSNSSNVSSRYTPPDSQHSLSVFTSMRDGNNSHPLGSQNLLGAKKKLENVVNLNDSKVPAPPRQIKDEYLQRSRPKDHFRGRNSSNHSIVDHQTSFRNLASKSSVNPFEMKREVPGRFPEAQSNLSNHESPSTFRVSDGPKPKPTQQDKHAVYDPYRINDAHSKLPYLNGASHVDSLAYDFRDRTPVDVEKRNGHLYQDLQSMDYQSPRHPKSTQAARGPSHLEYQVTPISRMHGSITDNPSVMRKPLNLGNSRLPNKRGTHSHRENEQRYGVSRAPPQGYTNKTTPTTSSDMASPHFPNGAVGKLWPPPYRLNKPNVDRNIGSSTGDDHFRVPCEGLVQKNVGPLNTNLDTTAMQDAEQNHIDYFSNAPGVDLDQVAASIPQKDVSKTNLMKVALEAFNIKRSRQQARLPDSSPSTSSSSKGSSPSSTMINTKKKQQQYL